MPRRAQPHYWKSRDAWYATIRGKQIRLATGKDAKQEAWAEFHRAMADAGLNKPAKVSLPTRELCDRFLHRVNEDLKPNTFAWYRRHLRSFCQAHGAREAADVRPYHVADWAGSHGWNSTNRRGAITAVKAAFAWGRKMGLLDSDPIRDLSKPTATRREKIPTGAQVGQIIANVSPRLSLLLEFLNETGARPGEAASLEARHVRWEQGVAIPDDHKTSRITGKPREIYLSDRATEILRALAAEHPEGPLFRNERGNPWTRNAMACAFRRLREKIGIGGEATAQAIRHRFGTDVAREHPNTVVAALLGHSSTAMADRHYIHMEGEKDVLRAAVEKVRPGDQKDP